MSRALYRCPVGAFDNSPAIHRRVKKEEETYFVPEGRLKMDLMTFGSRTRTVREPKSLWRTNVGFGQKCADTFFARP